MIIIRYIPLFAVGVIGCFVYGDCQTPSYGQTSLDRPGLTEAIQEEPLTLKVLERRSSAVYERAIAALVRVEGENGKTLGGETGVIVTEDGYVIYRPKSGPQKLTFRLADGRRVKSRTLGWSAEWGVGLAKLDDHGPWPHVELADSNGVHAGQAVITLGHSDSEGIDLFPRPLLSIDIVSRSVPRQWFFTSDIRSVRWRNAPAVFDLKGRLVGVGWKRWIDAHGGTVYTDVKVIRELWVDLVAGKNLDEARLRPNAVETGGHANGHAAQNTAILPDAKEKAKAASVRIRGPIKGSQAWSGVIITADGLVATCAHSFVMPGAKVTVGLPDGRDAAATVVGINPISDVGLIRILDKGLWPHAEMGDSTRLRPQNPCLYIGYGPVGNRDRQPSVRHSTIVESSSTPWQPLLDTDPKVPSIGGDSGGGVFDAEGRVVAFHGEIGGGTSPHRNMRIELIRKQWDELHASFEQSGDSPLAAADAEISRAAVRVKESSVEVLDGKKIIGLGTIVSKDGRILTLASFLPEAPICRLPNGRFLPATVSKISREHNLAILKIEATNLPVPSWSAAVDLPVATAVGVFASLDKINTGFVSHSAVSIPSERGGLWVTTEDGSQGPVVTEVIEDAFPTPFRKGDIIKSIDGHAIPNQQSLLDFFAGQSNPAPTSGDPLQVVALRNGKALVLHANVGPPTYPRPDDQTMRCSGYPLAYSVTVDPKSKLGGLVVDRTGRVLGVAAAWRARGWLLVFPYATAKAVIGD